jgi:putative transposase
MAKHRHSQGEILRKLHQAEQLATEGKSQRDIANTLNVSVMTYHRWRKANRTPAKLALSGGQKTLPANAKSGAITQQEIGKLQAENLRLRRLVTDLLLEKIKLEEEASGEAFITVENGHAAAV